MGRLIRSQFEVLDLSWASWGLVVSRYEPNALHSTISAIEVLNVKPSHKKAIVLLMYRADIKVLKGTLAR